MGSKKRKKSWQKPETLILIVISALLAIFLFRKCASSGAPKVVEEPQIEETVLEEKGLSLYVATDSLNMRIAPHLDSMIVARLPIKSEVTFLNERTNFRQKIAMNGVTWSEPWVKVKSSEGQQGWIYAAGVRFYPLNDINN